MFPAYTQAPLIELPIDSAAHERVADICGGVGGLVNSWLNTAQAFQARALVPEGTSRERACQLETGGLVGWGDAIRLLASILAERYGKAPAKYSLLAQDIWAQEEDLRAVARPGIVGMALGGTLYFKTDITAHFTMGLEALCREPLSFHFLAFVLPADLPLEGLSSAEGCDRLGRSIEAAIMTAYDRESFLLFVRAKD